MGTCNSKNHLKIYDTKKKLYENIKEIKRLELENELTTLESTVFDKIINSSFYFIVKKDKILRGIIIVVEKNLPISNEFAYINTLIVDKRFQKQGLATTLLTLTFDKMRSKGIRKVCLHVNIKNINAIKLFEKIGFIKDGIVKNYYGNDNDAYFMVKNIWDYFIERQ